MIIGKEACRKYHEEASPGYAAGALEAPETTSPFSTERITGGPYGLGTKSVQSAEPRSQWKLSSRISTVQRNQTPFAHCASPKNSTYL